jgi:putative spermidine/putrescine transport system substrate-binding protein
MNCLGGGGGRGAAGAPAGGRGRSRNAGVDMSRRRIAVVAGVLAVLCGVSACAGNGPGASSSAPSGAQAVRLYLGDDTNIQELWQKALIPAFEKANPGVTVDLQFDLHAANRTQTIAKLAAAAQQQKDPGIDVVEGITPDAGKAGVLADVHTAVPAFAGFDPKVLIPVGTNAVPYRASSVLLAYDTTKVATPPKTLDELLQWIKDHPGQFAYNPPSSGGSGAAFVSTVLDKYVPVDVRDQMTTGYHKELESNWDQGWATLIGLNPYVFQKGVYPNGNNGTISLLASGQVSMIPVWSDQFVSGQATGAIPKTVAAVQIENPPFTGGATGIGVVKSSDRQELATKLVNFVLEPAQQQAIANQIAGYPVIPLDKLPADVQAKFGSAHPEQLRPTYYVDHSKDMNNLWDQKVPGH